MGCARGRTGRLQEEGLSVIYFMAFTILCSSIINITVVLLITSTIITLEQEEAERQAEDEAREEKARIWADREKHLRTEH